MRQTLTPMLETFVVAFTQHHDPGRAAKEAGYTPTRGRTYNVIGRRILKKETVKIRIQELEKMRDMEFEEQKKRLQAIKENAINRISDKVTDILDIYDDLLKRKDLHPRLRFDVARDLLDRAGFKPTEKKEITGANGGPIKQENQLINDVADRARKLMVINGGANHD